MRVLMCGDRTWNDIKIIRRELAELLPYSRVIYGLDDDLGSLIGFLASQLGLVTTPSFAPWLTTTEDVGQQQGQYVLQSIRPDRLVVFHDNLAGSRLFKYMVRGAMRQGVPTVLVSHLSRLSVGKMDDD